MPDVAVLDVRLYDEPIGTLTHLQGDRTIFAFNEDYVENPDRPTLSLSFKDNLGGLITNIRPTQRVVPPFFSNLLPEGGLRRYLAERAGVNQQREFFLLWVLGLDLPGALSIHPAAGEALPPGADEDLPENARPNALRFSLAGVQLKFSALQNAGKGGGLTIPAEGVGGSWIVKLPSQQFSGVPENEFSMMTIAGMIGMEVPVINLVALDSIAGIPEGIGELQGQALAVSRFDRTVDGAVFRSLSGRQVQARELRQYRTRDWHRGGGCRRRRVYPPPRVQRADRQWRHAPQELVADLSGPASGCALAGLRPGVHHSLHGGRGYGRPQFLSNKEDGRARC